MTELAAMPERSGDSFLQTAPNSEALNQSFRRCSNSRWSCAPGWTFRRLCSNPRWSACFRRWPEPGCAPEKNWLHCSIQN
jgi:hypothetical protein